MNRPVFRKATKVDQDDIRALIFAILSEYDLDPAPASTDRDLDDIEGFYADGIFDCLEKPDGEMIGTVALKPIGDSVVELRKMYLKSSYRGRGYGGKLLKHAIAHARDAGFIRMELETARVLKEAIGLYEKFGFEISERADMEKRCDQVLALDLAN